jgi:phage-related minor tail protein
MAPPRKTTEHLDNEFINSRIDGLSDSIGEVKDNIKELFELVRKAERNTDMLFTEMKNTSRRLDGHHEKIEATASRLALLTDNGTTRSKMNEQSIQSLKEISTRLLALQERQAEKLEHMNERWWHQAGINVIVNAIIVALVVGLVRHFVG